MNDLIKKWAEEDFTIGMPLTPDDYDTFCQLCAEHDIECNYDLFNQYFDCLMQCKNGGKAPIEECANNKINETYIPASDMSEILKLSSEIGLETIADLEYFISRELLAGESVLDALKRYRSELGDDFKLNEVDCKLYKAITHPEDDMKILNEEEEEDFTDQDFAEELKAGLIEKKCHKDIAESSEVSEPTYKTIDDVIEAFDDIYNLESKVDSVETKTEDSATFTIIHDIDGRWVEQELDSYEDVEYEAGIIIDKEIDTFDSNIEQLIDDIKQEGLFDVAITGYEDKDRINYEYEKAQPDIGIMDDYCTIDGEFSHCLMIQVKRK